MNNSPSDIIPPNVPSPAPGSGQTTVTVGIDPSDPTDPDYVPPHTPRRWGTLSLFEKVAVVVISLAAVSGAGYGLVRFIQSVLK